MFERQRAFWCQAVPCGWLHRFFRAAQQQAAGCSHSWRVVRGPGGAVLATLQRLRWLVHSALSWQTLLGKVDLERDSPAFVGKLADLSTESALMRSLAESERCDDFRFGVFLQPLRSLLAISAQPPHNLWTASGGPLDNTWTTSGQPLDNHCAASAQPRTARAGRSRPTLTGSTAASGTS